MSFGYVIIYVESVENVVCFYEKAFGFQKQFIHESGDYAQLNTGSTVLAFASLELAKANFGEQGFRVIARDDLPPGIELGFVFDDVEAAYQQAISAGAISLAVPAKKPWGQTVAYVRSIEGTIVEICSPM